YINYYGTNDNSILYVSTTLDAVGSAVSIIRIQLVWVTVLSLIAGFVLSWFIAKSFSKPVAQLSVKADKLGETDYPKDFKKGFCVELDDLNNNLDKTSDKLIESRNFQMELLANVSHDLRTPLTMIKGYAEIIRDTSWDNEEQCSADIAVIVRETDRLSELVNEILEYSELKVGDSTEYFERINLSESVNKVCESFETLYKHREETIQKQIEENIFVFGNAGRLERAVYNLIDNAFRHTDENKKVTVKLSSIGNKALIEVTDHGVGIPQQEIEHIWDRYYTFRQRKNRGVSGLGLAIVKQTADMHNGLCSVESREGKGSTFRIELDKIE
ncbi:MAG: HAMP domain-containing histidine kinase, partial [Clostridia bacterium]|nr:HAMP domain-containing histidine kinase [Clostridia bacterium]